MSEHDREAYYEVLWDDKLDLPPPSPHGVEIAAQTTTQLLSEANMWKDNEATHHVVLKVG